MNNHEFPTIVTILAEISGGSGFSKFLLKWESLIFSCLIIFLLCFISFIAWRKNEIIPGKFQNAAEAIGSGIHDFICGILGENGRRFTPFLGTIFIYVLCMNLLGLFPFMKSPTSNWSVTLAIALCVFVYVQYAAFKELGFRGYFDHLAGKPRGIVLFSAVIPLIMLILHLITELIKPLSLSLRLRSNIWGDDLLLAVLGGFGISGFPLFFFNFILAAVAAVVQAFVFTLLSTVYFALILESESSH
ncbi:MAG: F0F1 ATP synthase subunit A [Candidatus Omnitrophota bacterium]